MAIGTAAAIVGGSLISGVAGSKSASKSAKAQTQANAASVAEQRRQFDLTQESFEEAQAFQREQLSPFADAGRGALSQQEALLGLSDQDAQQAAFAGLEQSSGQKFLQERAQKNLVQNASAIGGLGGGNVRSALVQQGVGFAQQDLDNQFNRLGAISGAGLSAATGVSQGALSSASQLGQFGQQSANNISNLNSQSGQARSSGIQQQNQAFQQSFGSAITGLGQSGILDQSQGQTLPAQNTNAFTRLA